MASPIPPDPYVALGVPKDADVSAIRTAHRKLALKHHPDRIKDESLREKGKDEFQKIQQAYELLSDPVRRSRYDDRVRLAELRKEAMMRDPPPTTTATPRSYSMRQAPQPQPAPPPTREFREDGNFFEEVRQPRNASAYDYRDPYDEVPRATTRKHSFHEKRPPQPKPAEKAKKAPPGVFSMASAATAAAKWKSATEKSRNSRAEEKRSDREKKRERSEKVQGRRTAYALTDSDSDHTEVRRSPKTTSRSKSSPQYESAPENPRRSTSRTEKSHEIDEESVNTKWERHHAESKAYIGKASNRPDLERGSSDAYQYWGGDSRGNGRRSGSDSERRPGSSKGRSQTEDYSIPPLPKGTSSPSYLRAHLEERTPSGATRDRERDRDRERERDRDREHRKMMPAGLHRAHTTPIPKATRRDAAPSKGSNLKHGESQMHDSGYSSSPHTPEMREESPPSRPMSRHTSSTKYAIQVDEDLPRATRLNKMYDDYEDRYMGRRTHSPETIIREPINREPERRPERPRVETSSRSKSSRGAAMMQPFVSQTSPSMRRNDSGRFEERASPRSPRETPPISRHNSGHEKLFAEISPDEREPSRYPRPYSADKLNMSSRRDASAAQYATYSRDPAEYRDPDYSSRFREAPRMRRPSVSAGGY